jgi:phage shock protein PspC (stress-responsive transcriptional regulator)
MWAFVLFCLSLVVTIYFYVKRNKIYDSSENLDNDTLDQYNKLDRMFIIMLLVTFGLFGLSTYVLGWFNF